MDSTWSLTDLPDMSAAKLLVISRPYAAGSAEEQTLQKMMAACKLSAAEYTVLKIAASESLSWQAVVGMNAPKVVMMLGVLPAQLSIHALFRVNAPNAFADRIVVPSLSLTEIEANPAVKKELWASALKPLFGQ